MEDLEIFEVACKYFLQTISEFKETLSTKVRALEIADWTYDSGITKVCQPDENDKKKRCKTGIEYRSKVELSLEDVETIWREFNAFFDKTYIADIERISNNEEIGRYEFITTNSKGDEIECVIYLSGEWNIPQIRLSVFVTARYKNMDFVV
ncbi:MULTISPECIES: hypothetical protein [Terrabacteria group]|uniref:hypothetical protein n=1 Tax=Bacillati TaxID=1783272 RepID=UPI00193AC499|nr:MULTISPECIES: hypothetical protein [Terrabacteria group]MBW9212973.1 hypothetical protein [Trueperella sp. zg.1013]QRG87032.1 hypothetical protein JOS54_01620 [Bulleidia sp. zg-1006]